MSRAVDRDTKAARLAQAIVVRLAAKGIVVSPELMTEIIGEATRETYVDLKEST